MCFCWIVMPKTRVSAPAAGAAFGALEVMMASIHLTAIFSATPHETLWFLGWCDNRIPKRMGKKSCRRIQGRRSMLKPEHAAARFGGGKADLDW